ncbi:ATP-dependent DNA ligase [Rivibacter subsaxonicus]|uniref:DNA ligase-1 n=1 Tax=Rivibacter subsaxonicus TaxID=457575 RepID=A0A4Q7VZI6_9BURK|nr:ATP-dependent DNA ligase [Rivibacter subsaxonicus]RZU02291.1 DNA ligase-1 [Rivibacter subsaxonicus]
MRRFALLYAELDAQTSTTAKVDALVRYFAEAPPEDAAWAVYFLAGGKPRQVLPTALLRQIALARAGIDDWLFEESYQAVGDLAETIALVLPPPTRLGDAGLAQWVEQRLLTWRGLDPAAQAAALNEAFDELDTAGRFLLVKLIGGGFRVGVSKLLVQRALAEHAGLDAKRVAQRMMGYTDAKATPTAARFGALIAAGDEAPADAGQPYPFFLAHALQLPLDEFESRLGPPTDWLAEWKYDGIRAQIVRRVGQVWIWSRGEELVTERFPEVSALAQALPEGTVLDGELLAWRDGAPAAFALLQQRLNRKTLSKKLLADAPVHCVAYDLLEWGGEDLRTRAQRERRALLEQALAGTGFGLSPRVEGDGWAELAAQREQSRARGVEGLMLKHLASAYGSGRTKADGTWWKWKIEPMSVDAVLVYAQAGHGRRASVYTDYSFAVWNRAPRDAAEAQAAVEAIAMRRPPPEPSTAEPQPLQLVNFAKAYSGLSDEEFKAVDKIIRASTIEKFGPVRSLRPSLVFELGFEGINRSARHKSGIAVRFPRMLRIRNDKPLHEADTLQILEALLGSS